MWQDVNGLKITSNFSIALSLLDNCVVVNISIIRLCSAKQCFFKVTDQHLPQMRRVVLGIVRERWGESYICVSANHGNIKVRLRKIL